MNFRYRISIAAVVFFTAHTIAVTASAHTVAGLSVEFEGDIDESLSERINTEIEAEFGASFLYDWLPPDEGINTLDSELQECFELDCLEEIGQELAAVIGLDIHVQAEDQIYEWTLDFYELATGDYLVSEEAACELCGHTEVIDKFRTSIGENLEALDVDDAHPAGPVDTDTDVDDALTEVRISTVPEDARIFIDEEPVGQGEASVELAEGSHEIRFSHDGHYGIREQVVVTEDGASLFVLRVHLREAAGEKRNVLVRDDGAVDRIEHRRKLIGWSSVGTGALLTLASIPLARRHGQPNCEDDVHVRRCPEVYDTAGLSITSAVVGTIGLVAGSALLAWPYIAGSRDEVGDDGSPEKENAEEARLRLAPSALPDFTGLSLSGRF